MIRKAQRGPRHAAARASGIATWRSQHRAQTADRVACRSREIEPTEADVVRRIFELCAAGDGLKAHHQAVERGGRTVATDSTGPAAGLGAVQRAGGALPRVVSRRVLVWNRTQKRNQWGQNGLHRPAVDRLDSCRARRSADRVG